MPIQATSPSFAVLILLLASLLFSDVSYTHLFAGREKDLNGNRSLGAKYQEPTIINILQQKDTQQTRQVQQLEHDMEELRQQLRGTEKDEVNGAPRKERFKPGSVASETATSLAISMSPTEAKIQSQSTTNTNASLPSCRSLMQSGDPLYTDGSFLTSHTTPVSWKIRADGSRELQLHSTCQLHRYTSQEAKQCLAGKHLNFLGDSLSRYQFMSLIWMLHKGSYPPRFGIPSHGKCKHIDENGNPTCSLRDQPNICIVQNWSLNPPEGITGWQWYAQSLGGRRLFDGHLEANAIKTKNLRNAKIVDNFLYASPSSHSVATSDNNGPNRPNQDQVFVSYVKESGWENTNPITMFQWKNCAPKGECDYSNEEASGREARALNLTFDYSQDLTQALNTANGGFLPNVLPPVDIEVYNRGIWGKLEKSRVEKILPLLYEWTHPQTNDNINGNNQGQCFFRTTTEYKDSQVKNERDVIYPLTIQAGCEYVDYAHLIQKFFEIPKSDEQK